MLRSDPARDAGAPRRDDFVLYLEGPRDHGVLQAWSRRLLPSHASRIFRHSVILGGRRPARALEHFRGLGGAASGTRGLCVLDRDDGEVEELRDGAEPGLEFFTWGRRHIESYLLVPAAIRRVLRLSSGEGRLDRLLRDHLPPDGDEEAYRALDAKRLLAPGGVLPRALGSPLPLARIARATLASELHADVHDVFGLLRDRLGLDFTTHRVVR